MIGLAPVEVERLSFFQGLSGRKPKENALPRNPALPAKAGKGLQPAVAYLLGNPRKSCKPLLARKSKSVRKAGTRAGCGLRPIGLRPAATPCRRGRSPAPCRPPRFARRRPSVAAGADLRRGAAPRAPPEGSRPLLSHTAQLPARQRDRGKQETWCERRDSNPHGVTHRFLKPARLPVPPLSQQGEDSRCSRAGQHGAGDGRMTARDGGAAMPG